MSEQSETQTTADKKSCDEIQTKYRTILHNTNSLLLASGEEESHKEGNDMDALEKLLESENQINKTKTWNKLDKTQRIQKLHAFAEKYVKEHGLPVKEIKVLKTFLSQSLDEQKLQKTKEVIYNKESREITNIPGLLYNMSMHAFYLKNMDPKHVSTIKSLTPKRITEKNTDLDA